MKKTQATKRIKNTPSSLNRRKALNKIVIGGALGSAVASMPDSWVKPVVNAVMLPAHAMTSLPTLEGVGANVTSPNPSGNIGTFTLTISSPDATASTPITINSLVPTSGSFTNFTPGVRVGPPLVLTWVSDPGFVDGTTGIVLAGMFAGATASVTGAVKSQYDFTIATAGSAP